MAKIEIDDEVIRKLAELMTANGLTEVEVAEGESRLRVSRAVAPVAAAAAPVTTHVTVTAPQPGDTATDVAAHPGTVKSPMVGTAYLAPEPGAAPFFKIGDKVKVGDTLLIIEAMKVMNPIKAVAGGTVSRILIDDGHPVEYGQPLLVVE